MKPSVSELISQYLQGDRLAGDKLFDYPEYQRKFKAIVAKYTSSNNLNREDVAQTARLKVIQALKAGKYNPDLGDFYHWALTVTRFAIIDLIRKSHRQTKVISLDQNILGTDILLGETVADDFDLLDTLEKVELVTKVRNIIDALDKRFPQKNYQQLFLAKIAGKTQKEIAYDLKITQSAVSKRWQELILRITAEMEIIPEVISTPKTKKVNRSQLQW